MTSITDAARFRAKPGVVATDLETEVVLLDPETREMFSLNATGRVVWRALPGRVADLAAEVTRIFEVDGGRALEDVRGILGDLLAAGLVVPEDRDA